VSRAYVLAASMALTFAVLRAYLHLSPNTDLDVAGYNVHHLFTGLVLLTVGGVAAVVLPATHRWSLAAVAVFGVGLSMALDEWVYLIVTDGTNESYVLPVSFWGAVVVIALAVVYALAIGRGSRD
jgi:hypothetical protein